MFYPNDKKMVISINLYYFMLLLFINEDTENCYSGLLTTWLMKQKLRVSVIRGVTKNVLSKFLDIKELNLLLYSFIPQH